jgi:hypothetical protein
MKTHWTTFYKKFKNEHRLVAAGRGYGFRNRRLY